LGTGHSADEKRPHRKRKQDRQLKRTDFERRQPHACDHRIAKGAAGVISRSLLRS
jgi:hypothetical protein